MWTSLKHLCRLKSADLPVILLNLKSRWKMMVRRIFPSTSWEVTTRSTPSKRPIYLWTPGSSVYQSLHLYSPLKPVTLIWLSTGFENPPRNRVCGWTKFCGSLVLSPSFFPTPTFPQLPLLLRSSRRASFDPVSDRTWHRAYSKVRPGLAPSSAWLLVRLFLELGSASMSV